jgi:hypothetical protein
MPSRKPVRLLLVLALIATCCAWLALASGCNTGGKTTQSETRVQNDNSKSTGAEDKARTEPTTPSDSSEGKTTPAGADQADVQAATDAAMASANSNNPALGPLDVLGVKIVDSWARVDMQPKNKSTDAASWLLKKANGTWTVVDFGTSIMPSDHPDAPSSIFQ